MKTALVTGASSGIGKAVTLALLDQGWTVYGLSRTDPGIDHDRFMRLYADLYLPSEVDLAGRWLQRPGLDAVVHCAAVQGPVGPLRDSEPSEWQACIQVNLVGAYELVRATLPALERRAQQTGDSRILLFSGGGSFSPRPDYSAYAVAKAGVVSLMETLAVELDGSGITVNCVAPGFVPTPMTGHEEDGPSPEKEQAVACVLRLLAPQTRGLTGKTISAPYDDWESINPLTVDGLNASPQGTRTRTLVSIVSQFARREVA